MNELHYTYRVEWSPEDDEWVGLVAELPSLSWLDPDPVSAMQGIHNLVRGSVADMRETGETPPEPLTERRYSGKVFVRTSQELHRRLTIEAAEQGVSVNQLATQKLSERPGVMPAEWSELSAFAGALRRFRTAPQPPLAPQLDDISAWHELIARVLGSPTTPEARQADSADEMHSVPSGGHRSRKAM